MRRAGRDQHVLAVQPTVLDVAPTLAALLRLLLLGLLLGLPVLLGPLLKAVLLNGTRLYADTPAPDSGWGRVWLDNNLYFKDYVVNYTNASFIVGKDFYFKEYEFKFICRDCKI